MIIGKHLAKECVYNKRMKTIYLAGGCFWGVEHYLKAHRSSASETVEVNYDEEKISLQEILSLFFEIIDPTLVDQQGHDVGHQYRTGIYYVDEKDIPVIQDALKDLSRQYDKPIVTELLPLENFTIAEDYHQDYLIKNPEGYCHVPFKMFDRAKNYKKN